MAGRRVVRITAVTPEGGCLPEDAATSPESSPASFVALGVEMLGDCSQRSPFVPKDPHDRVQVGVGVIRIPACGFSWLDSLAERKADFYRGLVHALEFFGGTPLKIILDNLKAAVLNGSGRAACLHPEFLALCGHYYLDAVPCARRDPESKGMVEAGVRYVKHNALAGRQEELARGENYAPLAVYWRDQVANVRLHDATHERPVDRFLKERPLLRALPALAFDTDEVVSAIVSPLAQFEFDVAHAGLSRW